MRGVVTSAESIIGVIRSRRMGLAGHVACVEEKRNAHRTSVGKLD
jgi:hypothetical protein